VGGVVVAREREASASPTLGWGSSAKTRLILHVFVSFVVQIFS